MIKAFNALTRTVWRRRFWLPLSAFVLALSLVGGVEAFVPTSELADLDDAVSIDAVVTPGQGSERARVTIRRSGARQASQRAEMADQISTAEPVHIDGQGDLSFGHGGIEQAVPPTGPPSA